MDRVRWRGKSKSFSSKFEGNWQIHNENKTSKLETPSVVAKLMGLDGLPSQQPIHRQQNSFVDNSIRRSTSTALQKDAHSFEDQSRRKSSSKQPEFKDVYEDTVKKSGCNKDLILELLQQPDSLFVKHLRGVQGSPSSSLCNHLEVLNQLNSEKYEAKAKGWKAERTLCKNDDTGSKQTHDDDILSHSYSCQRSHKPLKPLKVGVEGKAEADVVTTRIVILKPNYGKSRSAHNSFSSLDSLHANFNDNRNCKDYMSAWTNDQGYLGKIDLPQEVELSMSKLRKAQEIARKVTREMRETSVWILNDREAAKKFHKESKEISDSMMIDLPSCVRQIPATGGHCDFSRVDSSSESEVMKMTAYDPKESFVSRQAKKKLLARWRMVQRYEDIGVGGKSNTLGEMLSIPDEKLRNLDTVAGVDGYRDAFDRNNGSASSDYPLGISSWDGWKDNYSKLPSRSRSLPPRNGRRSEKVNAERESRIDDKLLMPKEVRYRAGVIAVNEKLNEKEDSSSRNSRSSKRKSQRCHHRFARISNSLPESHSRHDKAMIDLVEKDPKEEQHIVPSISTNVTSTIDAEASPKSDYIVVSPRYSERLLPDLSTCTPKYGDCSADCQKNSNSQGSPSEKSRRSFTKRGVGVEPESSESSKEADHPSPVSVLEVPLKEDYVSSGPECFEQVSADLHELRKQLQLLKRDSQPYAEAPMLIKNGTDVGEGLMRAAEEKGISSSDCWEPSYIVDVLTESGIYGIDTDMLMKRWHSSDFPLELWVFDNLEKKYSNRIAGLKHERKLLFDRIHAALMEISQSYMDPCPWVRPLTGALGLKFHKCEVINELHKLLAIQEKEANDDMSTKLLDKEMHWLDSRDSIDMIGTEFEKLLIDDLMSELLNLYNFK